jgi:hypothetical protein
VYPPTLDDFIDVTQRACCARAIVDTERALLRELGFTLHVPTALTFLTLYLPAAAANTADADAVLSAAIDGEPLPPELCGPGDAACCSGGSASSSSSDASAGSSPDSLGGACGPAVGKGGGGGSGSGAGAGGRFTRGARARLPAADARTGPRAAPRYPYGAGSPCPLDRRGAEAALEWVSGGSSGSGGSGGGSSHAWRASVVPPPALPEGALGELPRRVAHLAEYLAELSLLTPEALKYPPSIVAAAALHVACALLGGKPGGGDAAALAGHLAPAADAAVARAGPCGRAMLEACAAELRRMFAYASRAPRPPSVKDKYATVARGGVSGLPLPRWMGA